MDRVTPTTRRHLYGIQLLSSYASTVSIFIHTLRFKQYIGPMAAMCFYDIIIPGFAYLLFNLWREGVLEDNADLAVLCAVGMVLNLAPSVGRVRPWFVWQVVVAYLCYTGQTERALVIDPRLTAAGLAVAAVAWFRR